MLTSQLCFSEKKATKDLRLTLYFIWHGKPRLNQSLLVEGNRDSFKVVPRVVGTYYKRVTRIQCGEWLDPVQPGGPG